MKKHIQNFLAFLLIAFFAFTNVQAINLSFNGDIEKLNGDKNEKTCNTGDQFLLGLSDANVDGKELSILLTLTDVKNDVSVLIDEGRPCIGFEESYIGYGENNLKFILRNTDNVPGQDAYIDTSFTIIEKRDDNQHIPVEVDNVSFTAFDLDRWKNMTDKDTIYFTAPQINLSEEAQAGWEGNPFGLRHEYKNDVSDQESLLFGTYESRVVGRKENCDETQHEECKAGATFFKASTFSLKVHNKNAYSGSICTSKAHRLFVISFLEGEVPVSIASISDANATEGNVLSHSVTLTRASTSASEFLFNIVDNETTVGEDYSTTYSFSNGVTYDGTHITVPANTTTFDVSVTSISDDISDNAETYTVQIKDKTALGTIIDTQAPEVTMSSPSVTEGGNLVFDVNLSMKSTEDIYVFFSVNDSSTAEVSSDYEYIGVSWVKIPANTLGSELTIETIDDEIKEDLEEYIDLTGNVIVGQTSNEYVTARGTILDNDNNVGVGSIENASVSEGLKLYHRVIMSGISDTEEHYDFNIEDLTTSEGDYNPTPTFSHGVTYDGDKITVPRHTSEFYVIIQSNIDSEYEPDDESYKISIKDKEANGTIEDCKIPAVLRDDNVSRLLIDTENTGIDIDILVNDDSDINILTIDLNSSVPGTIATDTDGDGDIDKLEVPNEGTWTIDDEGVLNFKYSNFYYEHRYSPITYKTKDNYEYELDAATVIFTSLDIYDP